ncbi:hypothetical protein D3C81_1408750 [compost metagenome]
MASLVVEAVPAAQRRSMAPFWTGAPVAAVPESVAAAGAAATGALVPASSPPPQAVSSWAVAMERASAHRFCFIGFPWEWRVAGVRVAGPEPVMYRMEKRPRPNGRGARGVDSPGMHPGFPRYAGRDDKSTLPGFLPPIRGKGKC